MAALTVLEFWTAKFPASKEVKYTDSDGVAKVIEAREAREAVIILGKAEDGSCNQVEMPEGYTEKINVGDRIQLTVKDWPASPFRSRNVTRHQPAEKK